MRCTPSKRLCEAYAKDCDKYSFNIIFRYKKDTRRLQSNCKNVDINTFVRFFRWNDTVTWLHETITWLDHTVTWLDERIGWERQQIAWREMGPCIKKIFYPFQLTTIFLQNRGQQAYDESHAQTADPFNKHTTTETYGTVVFIFIKARGGADCWKSGKNLA